MPKRRVTAAQRRAVIERAYGCCEYCRSQARFATETFAAEHIIPRFKGGRTILANLALSCFGCNSHKHTKIQGVDPQTSNQVPLFHPRNQSWNEHFAWREEYTLIVGQTAIGRATIDTLQMNRQELINLRRVLRMAGEHPYEI